MLRSVHRYFLLVPFSEFTPLDTSFRVPRRSLGLRPLADGEVACCPPTVLLSTCSFLPLEIGGRNDSNQKASFLLLTVLY